MAKAKTKAAQSTADTIGGTPGNDLLYGTAGNDRIYAGEGDDTLYGEGGNDYLNGAGQSDDIYGGAGNDTLIGLQGHDYLDGGAGIDRMEGGDKDDTYIVDNTRDVVVEGRGEFSGWDKVYSSVTWTLGANVERLFLTGTGNVNGTGNGADNEINGNDGNNILRGLGGGDLIFGGAGNDLIEGGSGSDGMEGGAGADTVMGGGDGDSLGGHTFYDDFYIPDDAAADLVNGGGGDDWLYGSAGSDTIIGGDGDDYFILDHYTDITVVENAGGGIDLVTVIDQSYTLQANFEDLGLRITGAGNFVGTGNSAANSMHAYAYEAVTGTISLYGLGGNDYLYAQGEVAAYLDGGTGNDTLYGGDGNDTLVGGSGNDLIRVGYNDDTATGGAGSDNFDVLAPLGVATITDFEGDADVLTINNYHLDYYRGSDLPEGPLAASAFAAGTAATTAAHRFIWDNSSGALYYDPDGSGSIEQIHLANINVVSGSFDYRDIEIYTF